MPLPASSVTTSKQNLKEQLLPVDRKAGASRKRMSDFIDDFIEEYKNNPCLWKANSVNFKNRTKRQEAYMKLIDVATKHGEHYNIERTKQKINNLRCAFRHQLKKYTECKNSKNGKDEAYCPKRRYFESLMFLMEEEKPANRIKLAEKLKEIKMTKVSMPNIRKEQTVAAAPPMKRKDMTNRNSGGSITGDDTILQMKIGLDTIEELERSCVEILPEDETKEIIEIDPEEVEEEEEDEEEVEAATDMNEDVHEQHLDDAELCDTDGNEFCTVTEDENNVNESEMDMKNHSQNRSVYRTTSAEDDDHDSLKQDTSDHKIAIDCEDEEINILWPRPPPTRTANNDRNSAEVKSIEIVQVETQAGTPLHHVQTTPKGQQQTIASSIIRHDLTNSGISSASSSAGQSNIIASTTLTLPTSITIQPVPKGTPQQQQQQQTTANIIENQSRQLQRHPQTRQSLIRRRTASVSSNNSNVSSLQIETSAIPQQDQQHHHQQQQQQVHFLHSSNEQQQHFHHHRQSHQDTSSSSAPPEKKIKVDCSSKDFEKLLNLACSRIGANTDLKDDDNFSMFGRMVAHKLRSMDSQQAMFAEKIISDVLFDGHMRLLSYPTSAIPMAITQHQRQRGIITTTTAGIPIHHAQHPSTSSVVVNSPQTYVISSVDLNGTTSDIQVTPSTTSLQHHHQQQQQQTTAQYTTSATHPTNESGNNL